MLDLDYTLTFLEKLCKTASPSGFTENAAKLLEEEIKLLGYTPHRTNKGGVYTYIGGETNADAAIAAHFDTLGAMVRSIRSDGKIQLTKIGSYSWTAVECENCCVHTFKDNTYSGTIYYETPSGHVDSKLTTDERKDSNMILVLDEKISSADDIKSLGITVGNFVSFDPRYNFTEKGFVKSRHLDDKLSVAILMGILKYFAVNKISTDKTFQIFFSNYEEVGHGASSGIDTGIKELLCVDMGISENGQNGDEYSVSICTKDSSGPYDYQLTKKLIDISDHNAIKYKTDIFPRYGSDAAAALHSGIDAKFALIGAGIYASHSYERAHIDGISNTASLILNFILCSDKELSKN